MADRATVLKQAAAGLHQFAQTIDDTPVLVGFDGFVDSIIAVVDKRHDVGNYDPMRTIDQFGQRISAAAGQSSNFEFVVKLEKLGGNGPIMANALASMGLPVTYVGAVGLPQPHPVFNELVDAAEKVHSIANPGLTDAVEFDDGKLMLGKHSMLCDVNWQNIMRAIGEDHFAEIVTRSRLIGMVNWTMLTSTNDIWRGMIERVLPKVEPLAAGRRRMVFIDLADPEKRPRKDLLAALSLAAKFEQYVDTIVGFNLKEAVQVAEVLELPPHNDAETAIEEMAVAIREKLGVHGVVVHPRKSAAAAIKTDQGVTSSLMIGSFTKQPKLSTGAGDNFNAGFCLGLLAGLPVDQALCVGNAASGFYVRNARSATLDDLANFCETMPEPEAE